jgi:antitoxin (DNA-binding transcriptional repressor) of toxin-antitoxin stability system
MPERVSILEVRQRIGDLLSRVALRRDEFIIERKGKPLAALMPVERLERSAPVRAASCPGSARAPGGRPVCRTSRRGPDARSRALGTWCTEAQADPHCPDGAPTLNLARPRPGPLRRAPGTDSHGPMDPPNIRLTTKG